MVRIRSSTIGYSKRGQTGLDLIIVIVFLFVLALIGLFLAPIISDFKDEFNSDPELSTEAKAVFTDLDSKNASAWDNSFLFAVIMLWASLITSSFLIDTTPIFFIITVIVLVFIFIVGAVVANVYLETADDATFSSYQSNYPITTFVMNNLLTFLILMGFSSALSLYAKSRI